MPNTKETKFFNALKDVFIGAKVEGESGYINLMRIKSRYYENGVFPKLKKDINEALKPFPEFRSELFDKLYTFFHRYFSESGSIYFRYTPLHQNIYEKVYTDTNDVTLFWKTHMLYYVKSDRLFKSMQVEVEDYRFYFDVSSLQHKKANEKRDLIFDFQEKRKDDTLVFTVTYSERGRKTKYDDILRALKKLDIKISEDTLIKAFRVFEKQSEVDYFINKNAKAFLREQFDLWMYQYVFSGESEWNETRIKQLQVLKDIAFKIIDFISQFEDELVKIWNKPKFVLNSNYVITLDKIADKDFSIIEKLIKHKNLGEQLKEWKELGIIENKFKKSEIIINDLSGKSLNPKYKYLPVDTKYFKDIEIDILSLFDDLDATLDGWLIKSENYQALNSIMQKFRRKIQTTYIDPPYNSKFSEIIYVNRYKHSTWLSLMENRINLVLNMLDKDSIFISAIDENEQERFGLLLNELFPNNEKTCVTIIHNPGGIQGDNFKYTHEYAYFIYPNKSGIIALQDRTESADIRPLRDVSKGEHLRSSAKNCFYPIYVRDKKIIGFGDVCDDSFHPESANVYRDDGNIEVYPIDAQGNERKWVFARNTVEEIIDELEVQYNDRRKIFDIIRTKATFNYKTVWTDKKYNANTYGSKLLNNILGKPIFEFPKSIYNVMECLNAASGNNHNSIILDFFAGSGTTGHAVIELNKNDRSKRKFILIELGGHFDDALLPRMKKICYTDKWKEGKASPGNGYSQIFKYYQFEQYEDTLQKVIYEDADLFEDASQDPYNTYVFMRDLKMLEALEVDQKKNRVNVDLSKLYDNIDIPETLSNLTGKWIKKITKDTVTFEDGETVDLHNLDYKMIKPLIWW